VKRGDPSKSSKRAQRGVQGIAASTMSLPRRRSAADQCESREVAFRHGAVDGADGVRSVCRHNFCSAALFASVTSSASVSGRQASDQPVTIVLTACLEAIHALA
jgi:hypothetical protein